MSGQSYTFKQKLARIFDDNLSSVQYKNYVDFLIIFMIVLSTMEVFISTFDVNDMTRIVLNVIDITTLVFFIIEVALRIWVAPLLYTDLTPAKARLKYCTSFFGIIDLLSTVPSLLQWIIPWPVAALKVLRTFRIIRLFRITRYLKSFNLFANAIQKNRKSLFISLQFLFIITLVLSLLLYFAEKEAQPDVYENGFISVIWAFAQYIGDPGNFADTPPVTFIGKIIAFIVGILGIAIVAVPAGIIGSGFTDAIEEDRHSDVIERNKVRLLQSFQRKLDRPSKIQIVPPFCPIDNIKALLHIKEDDIYDVVDSCGGFRLVNLASTIPTVKNAPDRIAIEHYPFNRSYGCFIDRESPITVISPSSYMDTGVGNFAFYLALIGGFNYISKEIGDRILTKSYYTFKDASKVEGLGEYLSDLQGLLNRDGAWGITILAASGALEPEYPTNFHFTIGGAMGDERMSGEDLFVHDGETYKNFFEDFQTKIGTLYGLKCDHQKYHSSNSQNVFLRKMRLNKETNNIVVRIDWHVILWNPQRIKILITFAELILKHLAGKTISDNPILKVKSIGFDDYME